MNKQNYKSDVKALRKKKVYHYPDFKHVSVRFRKVMLDIVDELAFNDRRKRSAMIVELIREALIERGIIETDTAKCN